MKSFSPLFEQLQSALQALPGVGPRSAQRMALHLLERQREAGQQLAQSLASAIESIQHCERCHVLSEQAQCQICADPERETGAVLVVENPGQLLAFERAGLHDGQYFVLNGLISPLDGVSPETARIPALLDRVAQASEIILALSSSVEGEATAQYIRAQLPDHRVTRLARGVPMGSDVEQLDPSTLGLAFGAREVF